MRKVIAIMFLSAGSACAGLSKLEALSQIETGNNDTAIGRAGEVSRYQIKPWIWHRYSASEAYRNRQASSRVADKYLAELEETFRKRAGREPDDFDLYVLWNAGPTYYGRIGFSKRRVHPIIRERAQRFVNLRQMKDKDTKPRLPDQAATTQTNATPNAGGNDFVFWLPPSALPAATIVGYPAPSLSISPLPASSEGASASRPPAVSPGNDKR